MAAKARRKSTDTLEGTAVFQIYLDLDGRRRMTDRKFLAVVFVLLMAVAVFQAQDQQQKPGKTTADKGPTLDEHDELRALVRTRQSERF